MHTTRIAPADTAADTARKAAEAQIVASRGKVTTLYQLLLHNPEIAKGWESLLTAIRRKASLSPFLREMVILRIAVLNNAMYEFEAHTPFALEAGLSGEQITNLKATRPSGFSDEELQVLHYCDAMTRDVDVSDEIYQPIGALFDETTIMELTVTIAAYNMVSRFLEAMHVR
jgi:4-carboxymuconolactone decarboxylase